MLKGIVLAFTFFLGSIFGAVMYSIITASEWVYALLNEWPKSIKKAFDDGLYFLLKKTME